MNRADLLNELIREGYLETPEIIEAFQKIDRADFLPPHLISNATSEKSFFEIKCGGVPEKERVLAYENVALPIGYGSTISQPLTVAFMFEKLAPKTGDKILDIGSGSGWTSAMLAEVIAASPKAGEARPRSGRGDQGEVIGIEIVPELVERATKVVDEKYPHLAKRIRFIAANAEHGFPDEAPFDGIIAAAALADEIPAAWKEQLAIGGRIIAPVENAIHLVVREAENTYKEKVFPGFVFVPFQYNNG